MESYGRTQAETTKTKKLEYMSVTIASMVREITDAAVTRIELVVRRRSTISVIERESIRLHGISTNQNDMKYHALTMQQSMKALVLTIKAKICVMRKVQID